jgi:hypothetical protein
MARQRGKKSSGKASSQPSGTSATKRGAKASMAAKTPKGPRPQAIPPVVANRMARRTAIAAGIPTLMGMAVFVISYLLVSRSILDIPPGITLLASGGCFLLGLVGLSFGVLSSSWEDAPGSLLGTEQIGLNIRRLRASFRSPSTASTEK